MAEKTSSQSLLTDKVLHFYEQDQQKILEGKVYLETRLVYMPNWKFARQVKPLRFQPALSSVEKIEDASLDILQQYFRAHLPENPKGDLLFSSSAIFSLYKNKYGLSLYLGEEKDSAPGEAIDVLNRDKSYQRDLEEVVSLFKKRKVSSFVLGRLMEKKEYPTHILLRRYFKE